MLFEVVKAPAGSSPQWVRDAWVGIQFQALQGAPVSMATREAASGAADGGLSRLLQKSGPAAGVTQRTGYPVGARDVLGLLALENRDAALWYVENVPQMLNDDQVFMFDSTCCVAITEITNRA